MKIDFHSDDQKQSQMLKLLQFGTVMVFVDARVAGVVVPKQYNVRFDLRLNFDYRFEISDFRVLPDRIEATLSFNQKGSLCIIPFDAVYGMINQDAGQGSLFPDSIPEEMQDTLIPKQNKAEKQEEKSVQAISVVRELGQSRTTPSILESNKESDQQPALQENSWSQDSESNPEVLVSHFSSGDKVKRHLRLVK